MITRIRDVRKAKGLTLQEVADRCTPPTTPQTVGRLETGTRTVSMGWLHRIADALGVDAAELVTLPERTDLPVVAVLGAAGPEAPRSSLTLAPPAPAGGTLAMPVRTSISEYRGGDTLWLDRLTPDRFVIALNRDVLVPRPGGRFLFARLIGRETGRLQLLQHSAGSRQTVITDPPWLGVVTTLVRTF